MQKRPLGKSGLEVSALGFALLGPELRLRPGGRQASWDQGHLRNGRRPTDRLVRANAVACQGTDGNHSPSSRRNALRPLTPISASRESPPVITCSLPQACTARSQCPQSRE